MAHTNQSSLREDFSQLGKITQKVADDSLAEVRKGLKNYYDIGQEKMTEMEKKVEGTIRDYPLRALLAAAGIGFPVGWLQKKI